MNVISYKIYRKKEISSKNTLRWHGRGKRSTLSATVIFCSKEIIIQLFQESWILECGGRRSHIQLLCLTSSGLHTVPRLSTIFWENMAKRILSIILSTILASPKKINLQITQSKLRKRCNRIALSTCQLHLLLIIPKNCFLSPPLTSFRCISTQLRKTSKIKSKTLTLLCNNIRTCRQRPRHIRSIF